MNNNYYYFFISIFLAIATLPFVGMPFYKIVTKDENRKLAEFPDFKSQKLKYSIRDLNLYLADHHAFRNELSNTYMSFFLNFLNESPVPQKAILGQEDWLYLGDDYSNIYKYSLGTLKIDTLEIKRASKAVNDISEYCTLNKIKFYFTIAPSKGNIYPEFLPLPPNNLPRGKELMMKALEKEYNILTIDYTDLMLKNKPNEILYYKTDSHWNNYAGLLATEHLFNAIDKDFPMKNIDIEEYEIHTIEKETQGDIAMMLKLDRKDSDFLIQRKEEYDIEFYEGVFIDDSEEYKYTYSKNSTVNNKIKGLYFRDSFLSAMTPYIDDLCSESIYMSSNTFNENILNRIISKHFKPDFIIFQKAERNYNHVYLKLATTK